MPEFILWLAALVLAITSIGIMLAYDWRWQLGLLGAAYLMVGVVVMANWPIGMAAVKVVVGGMAASVLGMTMINRGAFTDPGEADWPEGNFFRLATGLIGTAITFASAGIIQPMMVTLSMPAAWGALLLIGNGLLHLGMTTRPLRVIVALLTVLAGFEILYAAIENSALVAALLAGITLGLALMGSYLIHLQEEPA